MRDTNLLQLTPPWTVARAEFDPEGRRLDIHLDFPQSSRFPCPGCNAADCPAYDTEQMTWRHLNFFQHQAWLHARVPRVHCPNCGIKKIGVPWARTGSGFTLLFEALVMAMIPALPVNAIARQVGEHDTRLWRVVHHYVDQALANTDTEDVTRVAIDETAGRRLIGASKRRHGMIRFGGFYSATLNNPAWLPGPTARMVHHAERTTPAGWRAE